MGLFGWEKEEKNTSPVVKVKVLGYRAFEIIELTGTLTSIYSLLVERADGSRYVTECLPDDKEFKELIYFIPMD